MQLDYVYDLVYIKNQTCMQFILTWCSSLSKGAVTSDTERSR